MTDIAHWPVHNSRSNKAAAGADIETMLAYAAFAIAFAVSIAFPFGII